MKKAKKKLPLNDDFEEYDDEQNELYEKKGVDIYA